MSFYIIAIIKTIILPPAINFLLVGFGFSFIKKNKTVAYSFIWLGSLTFLLFCFPPFSNMVLKSLEHYPALEPPVAIQREEAIVVLSGGSHSKTKEFGKPIDGAATLERNRYAAFLYKQTKLPVLVSGGYVGSSKFSEASVMTDTLTNSFNVPVKWQEEQSRNTAENAIYSVEILKQNNIDSIYLVTHAWHMLRAVTIFKEQGIEVTAAPTIFTSNLNNTYWENYLPTVGALQGVRRALHEYIGIIWYKVRY